MRSLFVAFKTAVACILIALLLSSCSFLDFFSVDSLIRPPKLTGENAVIQQAFEQEVGSDVVLLNPVSGTHRSAFVQYDLDDDGAIETMVFYAKNDTPSEAHMHLLRYDGKKWYSAGDVSGKGSEVYAVDFYRFNEDQISEIAVSWTVSDSRRNKTLALYGFDENSSDSAITRLSEFQVYSYLVHDFDSDGVQELIYFSEDAASQQHSFVLNMVKRNESSGEFAFVCEHPFPSEINLPVNCLYETADEGCRLYVDCLRYDGTYMTELLDYNVNDSVFIQLQGEEGAISEDTVRSVEVYSESVEDAVWIPVERAYAGSTVVDSENNTQYQMKYVEYDVYENRSLVSAGPAYFYAPDGSFRFRIDGLKPDYISTFDVVTNRLSFLDPYDQNKLVFRIELKILESESRELSVVIPDPSALALSESEVRALAEIL